MASAKKIYAAGIYASGMYAAGVWRGIGAAPTGAPQVFRNRAFMCAVFQNIPVPVIVLAMWLVL